jgi:glycosyltransferase involved in cell wall biosynthesis
VGGTLYSRGGFLEEALRGDYLREIRQGAWQESKLKSAVMALVLKRLHRSGWLECVKAWVCISEFLRDKLVQGAGLPPERVFALRHSWDAMPEAPAATDAGYYLFLGRLVEVKGLETLLQAWNVLEQKLGDRTPELWIAGEGPLDDMISAAATWMPKVRHLGLIGGELKHEAIRSCRAMLAPSLWWEPLGLVTYEAYDFAKPMLAARSGGLSETVIDGVTGFLHEPGNVSSLVDSVIKLETMSPEARAAMGAEGRRWLLAGACREEWQRSFAAILNMAIRGH